AGGGSTRPSGVGVTRLGSRKNSAHQIVSTVPIQPSGDHSQNRIRLTSAKMPMNGSPSRWTGTICPRIDAMIDMLTPLPYSAALFCCMGPRHGRILGHDFFLDLWRVAVPRHHLVAPLGPP